MPDEGQEVATDVEVTSIYGTKTRRGLVQLKVADRVRLMPPAKAREIAGFLLEAAGAAEGDEALMKVLERMQFSAARQGQFLMALRSERGIIDQRSREQARRAVAEDQFDPDRKG